VDAVLLAWFAGEAKRSQHAVDLGAGVGAVALSLLHRGRASRVTLVERDQELAALAEKNLAANGWADRGRIACADVTDGDATGHGFADLVVCNPPYVAPGRGRVPRVGAGARVGDLASFTVAARRVLGARGRAAFVYPAQELATLLSELRHAGLEPKRLCLVHATQGEPARVALVLSAPAKKGGLVVAPPFIERDADGASAELRAVLRNP
jgi:tRNA1Val (adenine37-N6)-methyltransferase